ncbi:MAG: hypothetical protein ACK40N_13875, partial [Meiothermus ruber]|uniref:hypothetical protein n=1 Tax=Meiothermus ruber TaxID=277 RepID=UPI00391DC4A5
AQQQGIHGPTLRLFAGKHREAEANPLQPHTFFSVKVYWLAHTRNRAWGLNKIQQNSPDQ